MPTYSEKLQSPLWQRKRLEIFNRDQWKCSNCGNTTKQLQVHHLDYIPGIDPHEYPDDMLTTLCEDCHKAEMKRPKHEEYLLSSLKMKGFLAFDLLSLSTKIDTDKQFVTFLRNLLRKNG